MKFISVLFLFVLTFTNFAYSQKYYTWEEYAIKFTLADDFSETQNDMDGFVALTERGIHFSITPFKDASVDGTALRAYTREIANTRDLISMQAGEVSDLPYFKNSSYKGNYVEGVEDGVRMLLMGIYDPNSENNFFVTLALPDGDNDKLDEAIEIVASIQKQ